MSRVSEKIYKVFTTKASSIGEDAKTIRFRVSDALPDRMNEIVEQSWNLKSFLDNPLALWGHKADQPENVIGTWSDFSTEKDGSYATLHVDEDINPKASLIWKQLVKGTLRCVSVGFVPHSNDWDGDTQILKDNELLEISVVPIPANPRAIALEYKAGAISKKDAAWLIKSMETEAEFIKKQMEVEEPTEKETSMNDNSKQLGAMMDAITSQAKSIEALAEGQKATNAHLDTVAEKLTQVVAQKGAVADIINAETGWEVDEEKWANVRSVAEIYWALVEAYYYTATPVDAFAELLAEAIQLWQDVADGKDSDEAGTVAKAVAAIDSARAKELVAQMFASKTAVAAPAADEDAPDPAADPAPAADPTKTKAADEDTHEPPAADDGPEDEKPKDEPADDENHDEDEDQDDLAKGGKVDQPGATDGEIDDDTELTPEQEEELRAELEAQYAASKS